MRASLLLLTVLASGCSLFDFSDDPLAFRNVPTAPEALPDSLSRLIDLVRTEDAAEALRVRTGLSRDAIPDVDWAREDLFLVAVRLLPSERSVVESVRLKRGVVDVRAARLGGGQGPERERRPVVIAVAIEGVPASISGLSLQGI